jgi:membrane protease YdiL (CAAX protease family)
VLEALFAGLVAIGLPLRAWRRGRRSAPPTPTGRYIVETLVLTACLAALLVRRGVTADAVGLRPASFLIFLVDLIVCLTVIVGMDLWSVWRFTRHARREAATLPAAQGAAQGAGQEGVFADTLSARRTLAAFIPIAITGAVWEELCFRATLFLFIPRTTIGLPIGIALGCLLFGAQHLRNGRAGFAYSAWFGLLFSLLYLITGDLIAVTIAHAAGNILAVAQWAPRIERSRRAAAAAAPSQAPIIFG